MAARTIRKGAMIYKTISRGELDVELCPDWSEFKKLLKMGYDEVDLNVYCHRHKLASNVIPVLEQLLKDILGLPYVLLSNDTISSSYVSRTIIDLDSLSAEEIAKIMYGFKESDSSGIRMCYLINVELKVAPTISAVNLNITGICHYEDEVYGNKILKKLDRLYIIDEILNTL